MRSAEHEPFAAGRKRTIFGIEPATIVFASAVVVLTIAALSFVLYRSEENARNELLDRFREQAEASVAFTAAALDESARSRAATAAGTLGGRRPTRADLERYLRLVATPNTRAVLVNEDGEVMLTNPPALGAKAFAGAEDLRAPLEGAGRTFTSDVYDGDTRPEVRLVARFQSADGPRVVADGVPAQVISQFLSSYLDGITKVAGGSALVLDSQGRVLGSGDGTAAGRMLDDAPLLDAVRAGTQAGAIESGEDRRFVSVAIPRTNASVVLAAPEAALLGPADDSADPGWVLLGIVAIALIAGTVVLLRHLRTSRELARAQERLRDPLTGLPNRAGLTAEIAAAIDEPGATAARAILVLDLDRFKAINGSFGQVVGDEVLAAIATRLTEEFGGEAAVARVAADEFALLTDAPTTASDATMLAARAHQRIGSPIETGDHQIHPSCSIGIALVGELAEAGLDNAAAALELARARGTATEIFRPELREHTRDQLHIESELRRALRGDELVVYYQPIVDFATGEIAAVEALVRWNHPTRGLVEPGRFIPVAEASGLIGSLGLNVLIGACRQIAAWAELHPLEASVNLSPRQLSDSRIIFDVARALDETGLEPGSVCLEVTETAIFDDPERARRHLDELKELGVKLALDDFGTGYSSLSHLVELARIDVVKVDRSFIKELERPRELAVVKSVLSFCEELSLISIAEGIETAEQASSAAGLGFDFAQGFLFARPLPAEQLEQLLSSGPAAISS